VLVELNVVEQRYRVVLEVLEDGLPVTEVAIRHGVSRQTVHTWLRRYRESGMAGLVDRSRRPPRCAHQISAEMERMVCDLRRHHPRWRPWRLVHELRRQGVAGFQDAPASIVCWTATNSSSPSRGVASAPCTGAGNGLVRWSSGRWTW